uniref:Uncharacterized protein n=1 Tax=Peronospora matthiolae TaxID=2874970 RepID=A0AAV1U7H6_9STRA
MLMGLEGRMERMEASQMQMDENERFRGAIESGLFSSLLGRNMGNAGPMHQDALGNSPPRRKAVYQAHDQPRQHPSVSPAQGAHVEPLGPQYAAPD